MTKVIVYSTENCPWCHKAKDFLKKHKISFTDKNVGQDSEAAHEMIKNTIVLNIRYPFLPVYALPTTLYSLKTLRR
jgi:glutaredoxin